PVAVLDSPAATASSNLSLHDALPIYVLAENKSAPSVVVVPRQVTDPEYTAKQLGDILDIQYDKAYETITKNASSVDIRPKGKKINKDQEKAIRQLKMDGVYLAKDAKRHYPYDDYLSHVLGFTGIDKIGRAHV